MCPFPEVTIWTIKTRFVAFASELSPLLRYCPAFFDFGLISLKNGNLYQWFIFFEKKKRKKWKNGWYGIAHYSGTWLKKKKNFIFWVWRTQIIKKKSDVIFRHPIKNQYKKIKKLMKSRLFLFFCINFLRGVGIWRRIFFCYLCSSDQKYDFFFIFFSQVPL